MTEECYIVADVGGTHVRFAAAMPGEELFRCKREMFCADFAQFDLALDQYLSTVLRPTGYLPLAACFAVAGAVHTDPIPLTNSPWRIDRSSLAKQLQCPVVAINDFVAQASYLPALRNEQLTWLRAPTDEQCRGHQVKVVIGPGTGLGAAACLPGGDILAMEAGNSRFNPATDLQQTIARTLAKSIDYIPVERVVSGPGLALIYSVLAQLHGQAGGKQPAEITAGAQAGDDLCLQTIREFSAMLGAACGDIALTLGSWGGVYLSGGVLNKLGDLFSVAGFLDAFSTRGHFSAYCQRIPIANIRVTELGLLGALRYLQNHHPRQLVKQRDSSDARAIGKPSDVKAGKRRADGIA